MLTSGCWPDIACPSISTRIDSPGPQRPYIPGRRIPSFFIRNWSVERFIPGARPRHAVPTQATSCPSKWQGCAPVLLLRGSVAWAPPFRYLPPSSEASSLPLAPRTFCGSRSCFVSIGETRRDEKAGLQRDALSSQVIDGARSERDKETGYEEA